MDDRALDALQRSLAELRPALLVFARRACRDAVIAEDLVQEALAAAVASSARFEGRAQARTWITGILAHKIADHFRSRSRSASLIDDQSEVDLSVADNYRSPESNAARRQALTALSAALATLPALERLAVLSVDVETLDHDEVCNALGVTATHLRVLLHRGRHKLRKAIEHAVL